MNLNAGTDCCESADLSSRVKHADADEHAAGTHPDKVPENFGSAHDTMSKEGDRSHTF